MPVDSTHPLYDAFHKKWVRCRDAYDGEDAVKERGVTYLPKPGGLTKDQYEAYVARTLYYEAVGRTIAGFVGSISRKDPVIVVSDKLNPILEDATLDGVSLAEFIKLMCVEDILQGRGGLLVDFDEKANRAFFSLWQTESITNWDDNEIILRETVYERDEEDPFKKKSIEQYRQLSIVDGSYTVTLWRKARVESGVIEWVVYGEPVTPNRRGQAFDTIPFFWLTPLGKTPRVENPPLLGLVNVAFAHYRNSADYEHGLHFTGLPTFYITGIADSKEPIHVGAMAAILLPEKDCTVGYAEVKGDFKGLENAMEAKEEKMAVLGASLFHDGPRGVEAAETARIRTNGQTSLLIGITTAIEETVLAALNCAAEWMSVAGTKIEVTLNREFVDTKMDGPTLTGLVQAYQSGALSLNQFLYNLQQGELLAPDTDIEEEALEVEADNLKKAKQAVLLAQSTKPTPKPKD